jgi:hypothetical protein
LALHRDARAGGTSLACTRTVAPLGTTHTLTGRHITGRGCAFTVRVCGATNAKAAGRAGRPGPSDTIDVAGALSALIGQAQGLLVWAVLVRFAGSGSVRGGHIRSHIKRSSIRPCRTTRTYPSGCRRSVDTAGSRSPRHRGVDAVRTASSNPTCAGNLSAGPYASTRCASVAGGNRATRGEDGAIHANRGTSCRRSRHVYLYRRVRSERYSRVVKTPDQKCCSEG